MSDLALNPDGSPSCRIDVTGSFDAAAERTFVAAARRGEPAAVREFEQRLRCVPRFVERLNVRLGRRLSPDDVLDAVQDVALIALRNLDRFHGRVPLEAWLHRICFLTLQNRLRARRTAPQSMGDAVEDLASDPNARDSEQAVDAVRCLERIGGVEADIVTMRHVEGLSFEDIAARLETPLPTVKTRYYRTIRRIQSRLAPGRGGARHEEGETHKEEEAGDGS